MTTEATSLIRFLPPLFIGTFFACCGLPHLAYAYTDVFRSTDGRWYVSYGGTGGWQEINTSGFGVADLRFGNFDGDCRTDVFRSTDGNWYVSYGGTGGWQVINTSGFGVADLGFGDFDGDGRTDVFRSTDGKWYVSYGGTGGWTEINVSAIALANLRFGDFNGDGPFSSNAHTHVCPRIARFHTSQLTGGEADGILRSATDVLQTIDGPHDVACLITFRRT